MNKPLTYIPEYDHWTNERGNLFIKSEFDPGSPVFIDVSSDYWEFGGYINWAEIDLPIILKDAAKAVLKQKLKSVSSHYVDKYRLMLEDIASNIKSDHIAFDASDTNRVLHIWESLKTPSNRIFFREMYGQMAKAGMLDAKNSIYLKLKQTKARKNVRSLKDVLNWHPTKGALTPEEENLIRNHLEKAPRKDNKTFGVSLFGWLLFATLKRGKQIRELRRDCLKCIENDGIKQHFVQIKPVKAQTGDPLRLWPIPEKLYEAMVEYSEKPTVKALQEEHDRFLVIKCSDLKKTGVIPQAIAKSMLTTYCNKIISPRTKQPIHVTPTRIRHTGATRMAYSGVSRDIIAEILEHDDPCSCQSYIDAIGSELCPQINTADRNMGSFFKELNQVYFNGKIVDELSDQPVLIPTVSKDQPIPLFVGSCGRNTVKEGNCHKHPFIGCYNGCPSFLAWREADHRKALNYIETEIDRWNKTAVDEKTATTIKEFEAVKDNILTVIANIESNTKQV
ncbi:tyrosine-type recombinase/integrase [Reinekea marinisedimentorum]|uniref:Phage integrase family protein n=1 Tax=Reinekea marinisedimentorum TaxID=230495 RepID=A0A4R3I5M1_9GAMM|nr:tyrosine-type recombinase/integrase [Reinekea marinisedimentorum]TCS40087.1 phage integrase family protein [Reinekea marinisedimentorum]